jgi:hypothetical protein
MGSGTTDWRVRGAFGVVDIELHPSSPDTAEREASVRELERLIYDFKNREGEARRILLEVYARLHGIGSSVARGEGGAFDTGSPQAAAIGAELAAQVGSGNLALRRRVQRAVVIPLDAVEEPVLGPEAEPMAWISIELVDDEGNPVPNTDYRIECDDGRVRTGTTNLYGKAREEGLHDGSCKVTFPSLNPPDWKKVG